MAEQQDDEQLEREDRTVRPYRPEPGKENIVFIDPGKPISDMTDEEIREVAGQLYDTIQARYRETHGGRNPGEPPV